MYRMPRKKMLTQDAIPTTSLADMMFLLLIFFIMTATLARVTGIVTDMPAGSKTQQAQAIKNVYLSIHDNKITVDDKDMNLDQTEAYLKGLNLPKRSEDARVVILSAAGREDYQLYYRMMSLIQKCGGVVAIESEEGTGK
jgi:biopolymer transport protein ExbD